MSHLYELTGQYQFLLGLAQDPDTDPNILRDSLEAITGEIEDKADGIAKVRTEMKAHISAMKAERDRFDERIKVEENNIKRLEEYLKTNMIAMEMPKIKTAFFTFSVQKNPAHVVLDEQYVENIPERYLVKQDPKIDKKLMMEDLKAGKDLEGICHLEQDMGIRIR